MAWSDNKKKDKFLGARSVKIKKYKDNARYWAVWLDGELLAVVVYKKGAQAIRDAINKLLAECN